MASNNISSPPPNKLSYAIPMPYIPSNPKDPPPVELKSSPNSRPEMAKTSEISIDLLTERRSSLELSLREPSVLSSPSHHLLSRSVQSTAVVKYSSSSDPAPLARLAEQTDLKRPPTNWLRDNPSAKGFVPSPQIHAGFTSFRMANDFVDCLADVDVVSDGENIKKLLKIPYSKTPISMVVHRVGKTILLDDFDIHRYLLRRSASQWEWIRKFFTETVLQQIDKKELEGAVIRKNASSSALQERNLVSKFLYRTLQNSLESEIKCEEQKSEISSLSLENLPPLPDPEPDKLQDLNAEKFARNLLWNFEDIRMLIGSNMPIFGDAEHPCVSLRLRDMNKPINILTGMDYWLDNLMCQVPEVVMCYHLDGIVQKYELLKTEDLPTIDGSKFSPKIVKNIAQNILSFLKSNAAKEGHTYWLFKAKDDDIVKLYDLTSLGQQDSGIKPGEDRNENEDVSDRSAENATGEEDNPFQTPVSMLLYRLARSILESGDRGEEEGTVRELLTNCVQLLDAEKFPHIATSAHFLLSELYLPDDTDPAMPAFNIDQEQMDSIDENEGMGAEGGEVDSEVDYSQYSVEVQTLCLPGSLNYLGEKRSPPICATTETRCVSALKHIDHGLRFLSSQETKREKREAEMEKERERVERDNLKMSVPNKPIPMGYIGNSNTIQRTRSVSEGAVAHMKYEQKELTWTEYLKFLLLKKSLLVYITLSEVYFNKKHLGRTLKCVKRAMNCHSMVLSLGGQEEARPGHAVLGFALGVAGDSYMGCVANWDSMPVYQEQYNTALPAGSGIAREVEKYTTELDRDWTIKQPRDIREAMELAIKCYSRALELVGSKDVSLVKRLANVENELGVFYMNQATALVQKISDNQELAVTAMAGAQDLFNYSRKYLNQGIAKFESISDLANTALLLSNSGRLSRLAGHAAGLNAGQDGDVEFGGEEAGHYRAAVEYYHQALAVLGSKKTSTQIWDTVCWELSSTLYTVGTLLQDHAPLSTQSRDEVEKAVTEHMSQALKYCDTETVSPRQIMYQTRAAVIHHRLASLYHHSYRCYALDDNSNRKKKLKQLSELHYVKASQLFLLVDRLAEYIRTVLERAGLVEAQLPAVKGDGAKYKLLLQVLDIVMETGVVVAKLAEKDNDEEVVDQEEKEEEKKMLETVVQRIQFLLLSMVKLGNISVKTKKSKGDKKGCIGPPSIVKESYAAALKCSGRSSSFALDLHNLITRIGTDRGAMSL